MNVHKDGGFEEKGGKWEGEEEDASPWRGEIPLDICNRIEIQIESVDNIHKYYRIIS